MENCFPQTLHAVCSAYRAGLQYWHILVYWDTSIKNLFLPAHKENRIFPVSENTDKLGIYCIECIVLKPCGRKHCWIFFDIEQKRYFFAVWPSGRRNGEAEYLVYSKDLHSSDPDKSNKDQTICVSEIAVCGKNVDVQ